MKNNTISDKQFRKALIAQNVTNETGYSSFSTDTKDMNFSASLEFLNENFSCSMWIGESEEETELSESQKDTVYNFLVEEGSNDLEFNEIDKDHALTLIYS